MKERPILFSGEMVRAILDGRKTQTRRVIKKIALDNTLRLEELPYGWLTASTNKEDRRKVGKYCAFFKRHEQYLYRNSHECIPFPYGEVGDRLWVRETHRLVNDFGKSEWADYMYIEYRSDPSFATRSDAVAVDRETFRPGWRPSIHMHRWASRITLEITGVRVERVQDISEIAAIAEGAPGIATSKPYPRQFRDSFEVLWNLINAKRGFCWDANPWVWVIEFKRIEQSESNPNQTRTVLPRMWSEDDSSKTAAR